jgi:hypothetical protein
MTISGDEYDFSYHRQKRMIFKKMAGSSGLISY